MLVTTSVASSIAWLLGRNRSSKPRCAPLKRLPEKAFQLNGMFAGEACIVIVTGSLVKFRSADPMRLLGPALNFVTNGLYRGSIEVRTESPPL